MSAQRRHLEHVRPGTRHVIVSMGDPQIDATIYLDVPEGAALPLAAARNAGVAAAIDGGADLVVLLDVDCLPGARLLERYEQAARTHPDSLLCGPVTYLPPDAGRPDPADLEAWRSPHPARPAPPDGTVETGGDPRLFWSLSFAVTPRTWRRLGGFCEDYTGYGGEDTDLGFTARERGIDLVWVGGADAYHQHHPVSDPPREHVADIVRNATVFHQRWGVWPMEGWLAAFEREGLVVHTDGRWRLPATSA
nr:galactosyltransferase-related protein [Arsenicicoccus piscis]